MANFRIDLLMNMQEGGWSEVYYTTGTDLPAIIPRAKALASQRTVLNSTACTVVGARIVPLDASGNPSGRGKVLDFRNNIDAPPTGVARDQYTTAIRVTFKDSPELHTKFMWMRGLADDSAKYDPVTGRETIDPGFKTKLDAYVAYLNGDSFQIKYLNPNVNQGDIQYPDRVGFTTEGALRLTFKVAPPAAFAQGLRVIVRKYRGALGNQVNGRTRVLERDLVGALTLGKWATYCADQETMAGSAELVKEVYGFTLIADASADHIRAHKVGRPFFLQVGRVRPKRGCPVTLVAPASTGSALLTGQESVSSPSQVS